jgi:hypothetical protein
VLADDVRIDPEGDGGVGVTEALLIALGVG